MLKVEACAIASNFAPPALPGLLLDAQSLKVRLTVTELLMNPFGHIEGSSSISQCSANIDRPN